MMARRAALLILALAAALPAHAQNAAPAQNPDGMTPAIAECLQKNAAAVEAAEPDLTKATDYLVSDICAAPVAEEQRRITTARNEQNAERNRAQCQDRVAQQKAQDVIAGQPSRRTYENCDLVYNNQVNANSFVLPLIGIAGARPPAVVSMASRLILDLRLAHNKPRP